MRKSLVIVVVFTLVQCAKFSKYDKVHMYRDPKELQNSCPRRKPLSVGLYKPWNDLTSATNSSNAIDLPHFYYTLKIFKHNFEKIINSATIQLSQHAEEESADPYLHVRFMEEGTRISEALEESTRSVLEVLKPLLTDQFLLSTLPWPLTTSTVEDFLDQFLGVRYAAVLDYVQDVQEFMSSSSVPLLNFINSINDTETFEMYSTFMVDCDTQIKISATPLIDMLKPVVSPRAVLTKMPITYRELLRQQDTALEMYQEAGKISSDLTLSLQTSELAAWLTNPSCMNQLPEEFVFNVMADHSRLSILYQNLKKNMDELMGASVSNLQLYIMGYIKNAEVASAKTSRIAAILNTMDAEIQECIPELPSRGAVDGVELSEWYRYLSFVLELSKAVMKMQMTYAEGRKNLTSVVGPEEDEEVHDRLQHFMTSTLTKRWDELKNGFNLASTQLHNTLFTAVKLYEEAVNSITEKSIKKANKLVKEGVHHEDTVMHLAYLSKRYREQLTVDMDVRLRELQIRYGGDETQRLYTVQQLMWLLKAKVLHVRSATLEFNESVKQLLVNSVVHRKAEKYLNNLAECPVTVTNIIVVLVDVMIKHINAIVEVQMVLTGALKYEDFLP